MNNHGHDRPLSAFSRSFIETSTKRNRKSCLNGLAPSMTFVFVVLKLTGQITWSWLWVLSPIIISTAMLIIVLFFSVAILKTDIRNSRKERP